ncbi:MAG: hypothetical protein NTW52_10725 [Planctomycetota bacterium]|nr:hypothetical protein [Planctomycetota bacterium]
MDGFFASNSRFACLLAAICLRLSIKFAITVFLLFIGTGSLGCNFIPDVRHEPRFHNPFPQIQTIAILPFRNQSEDPTLSADRVTLAYYDAAQGLPGFEVLPIGLVENQLSAFEQNVLGRSISNTEDIQRFANHLGVDAVLQGSVTDYDAYFPPRMAMKVNWYAANPGFHPIPPGYGLPWGTKAEKKIPQVVKLEAERALAREQIATQTPIAESPSGVIEPRQKAIQELPPPRGNRSDNSQQDQQVNPNRDRESSGDSIEDVELLEASNMAPLPKTAGGKSLLQNRKHSTKQENKNNSVVQLASYNTASETPLLEDRESIESKRITVPTQMHPLPIGSDVQYEAIEGTNASEFSTPNAMELPPQWPDPQGFIPALPKPLRPVASAQSEPIISHMRSYNGSDGDFTQALSDYYYFRDDGRFGGWEAYLHRSEDFIRFCCHQHMVETLAARGGELKSRTVVRWPLNRYDR